MAERITPLIVGNWKMNGLTASLIELDALADLIARGGGPRCTIVICPPATLLADMSAKAATLGIVTGGQDCHPEAKGAFTGSISAAMLLDAGAQYVIVGHSERRTEHGETDELVRRKAVAALSAGLKPVICVGETRAQRDAGETLGTVMRQVAAAVPDEAASREVIVAYEPVWAIGTDVTPTMDEIAEVHDAIRASLGERFGELGASIRILYGGSVKPANARDILMLANVNGALVGGASLLATDFHAIISAV